MLSQIWLRGTRILYLNLGITLPGSHSMSVKNEESISDDEMR